MKASITAPNGLTDEEGVGEARVLERKRERERLGFFYLTLLT